MSKIINLNEGGIKENIESINKRLVFAYSMLLFIFIGFKVILVIQNFLLDLHYLL